MNASLNGSLNGSSNGSGNGSSNDSFALPVFDLDFLNITDQIDGFKNATDVYLTDEMRSGLRIWDKCSVVVSWLSFAAQLFFAVRTVMSAWKSGQLPAGCCTGVISFIFAGVLLMMIGGCLAARVVVSALLDELNKQLALDAASIFH